MGRHHNVHCGPGGGWEANERATGKEGRRKMEGKACLVKRKGKEEGRRKLKEGGGDGRRGEED